MDFMATFMDVAQAKYPTVYKGHRITPTMGISLLPVFKGEQAVSHSILYNEHFGARYIRDDEWKLVSLSNDTTWHLYRINEDQTELNDLSKQYRDVVERLADRWWQWANTHQVFPKRKNNSPKN
jgi:arylsulfatase